MGFIDDLKNVIQEVIEETELEKNVHTILRNIYDHLGAPEELASYKEILKKEKSAMEVRERLYGIKDFAKTIKNIDSREVFIRAEIAELVETVDGIIGKK